MTTQHATFTPVVLVPYQARWDKRESQWYVEDGELPPNLQYEQHESETLHRLSDYRCATNAY
jgi:hypothetical protein